MSTHKHFDKICCIAIAIALLLTVVLMNGEMLGIQKQDAKMGYEERLFDTSKVHTIDIIMDDWEGFLETCTNEEYSLCSVVIDGEAYKNVAIRAKGNTSLTQVASYGNDRYSFKIEFDHYDSGKTYYGLDKLCLNNMIQDNTYMKDYLTYQLMGMFGTAAPLCSFVNISVNGEVWGLYLAVEGVEEAFLERNYGGDYGELYKPDSTEMGGGRGNGKNFDMEDWNSENENDSQSDNGDDSTGNSAENGSEAPQQPGEQTPGFDPGQQITPPDTGSFDGSQAFDGSQNDSGSDGSQNFSGRGNRFFGENSFGGGFGGDSQGSENETAEPENDGGNQAPENTPFVDGENAVPDLPNRQDIQNDGSFGDFGGGMGSMGSEDVSLIYTDDSYESYSNIFNNAKTDITDEDKDRLIASLKNINENTSIETSVDVDQVIRYFVVHNFVLNFDSYTGSMIHNYYLYESDGVLSMIPWDYNLAFGGFQSASDATSLVNYPIDSPVSGGTIDSRPMLAWIFNNEEYTEMYHQYFQEFISQIFDSGVFSQMMDEVKALVSPYVEEDPTKFCTYDEFVTGIDTLREFCLLRAQSISGQLEGTIGSTTETQQDKENFIDAGDINISDMGSMNNSMGGGMGGKGQFQGGMDFRADLGTEKDTTPNITAEEETEEPKETEAEELLPGQEGDGAIGFPDESISPGTAPQEGMPQEGVMPQEGMPMEPGGFDQQVVQSFNGGEDTAISKTDASSGVSEEESTNLNEGEVTTQNPFDTGNFDSGSFNGGNFDGDRFGNSFSDTPDFRQEMEGGNALPENGASTPGGTSTAYSQGYLQAEEWGLIIVLIIVLALGLVTACLYKRRRN